MNYEAKVGRAAFLHVPANKSAGAIELGADVAVALIAALVDEMEGRGERDEGKGMEGNRNCDWLGLGLCLCPSNGLSSARLYYVMIL